MTRALQRRVICPASIPYLSKIPFSVSRTTFVLCKLRHLALVISPRTRAVKSNPVTCANPESEVSFFKFRWQRKKVLDTWAPSSCYTSLGTPHIMVRFDVTPDAPADEHPAIGVIGMGSMGTMYVKYLAAGGWKRFVGACSIICPTLRDTYRHLESMFVTSRAGMKRYEKSTKVHSFLSLSYQTGVNDDSFLQGTLVLLCCVMGTSCHEYPILSCTRSRLNLSTKSSPPTGHVSRAPFLHARFLISLSQPQSSALLSRGRHRSRRQRRPHSRSIYRRMSISCHVTHYTVQRSHR